MNKLIELWMNEWINGVNWIKKMNITIWEWINKCMNRCQFLYAWLVEMKVGKCGMNESIIK